MYACPKDRIATGKCVRNAFPFGPLVCHFLHFFYFVQTGWVSERENRIKARTSLAAAASILFYVTFARSFGRDCTVSCGVFVRVTVWVYVCNLNASVDSKIAKAFTIHRLLHSLSLTFSLLFAQFVSIILPSLFVYNRAYSTKWPILCATQPCHAQSI